MHDGVDVDDGVDVIDGGYEDECNVYVIVDEYDDALDDDNIVFKWAVRLTLTMMANIHLFEQIALKYITIN